MASANEEYLDRLIERQVRLLRFAEGAADRVIRAIDVSEGTIVALIRERLARIGEGTLAASKARIERLQRMLREVRVIRRRVMEEARRLAADELAGLAADEVDFVRLAYARSVDFAEARLEAPAAARVRAVTFGTPFGAGPGSPVRRFSDWFRGLADADSRRVEGEIFAGFLEGDTIEGIVRRVRGTSELGRADGVTEMTRRQARTLVRTSVNHFSNAVREEVFATNDDVVSMLQWVSTLDGRTTAICQSRDGKLAPLKGSELPEGIPSRRRLRPPEARPPAHPNCRSVMVAVLDPEGVVGKRPFVTDTRTRREREIDFRREARSRGVPIQRVRAEWARERVGQVPARTTYQDWLQRRPAAFQDEVLGPSRGKLFRQGGLTLDRFVDTTGNKLTLEELKELHRDAFVAAGLEA